MIHLATAVALISAAFALEPYHRVACITPHEDRVLVGNELWYSGKNNVNWSITEVADGSVRPKVLDSLETGMGWVDTILVHPSGDVFAAGPFDDLQKQESHWLIRRRKHGSD